ncbi:unnamed protein product, partial [Phaeothamnion confervicola]
AFQHFASEAQSAAVMPFDPYDILQISAGANATVVRAQYRRLSLQVHPDKRPNDAAAAADFARIAKAYKTLTDPQMKENWRTHGHPDGPRPWSVGVALPAWLVPGADASPAAAGAVFLLYFTIFAVVLLACFSALRRIGDGGRSYKAGPADFAALSAAVATLASETDVVALLASIPGLCTKARAAVTAPLRDNGTTALLEQALAAVGPAFQFDDRWSAAAAGGSGGGGRTAGDKPGAGKKKDKGKSKANASKAAEPAPEPKSAAASVAEGAPTEDTEAAAAAVAEAAARATAAHNRAVFFGMLHGARFAAAAASGTTSSSSCGGGGGGSNKDNGKAREEPVALTAEQVASLAAAAAALSTDKRLQAEQAFLSAAGESLLDALVFVAKDMGAFEALALAISAKSLLLRRLWS